MEMETISTIFSQIKVFVHGFSLSVNIQSQIYNKH